MPTNVAQRDIFANMRDVTAQGIAEAAPIKGLAQILRNNPELLQNESPITVLANASASSDMAKYQVSNLNDPNTFLRLAMDIERDINIHDIYSPDTDNLITLANALRHIASPQATGGRSSTGVLLNNISLDLANKVDPFIAGVNASYDSTNSRFEQNPLGILQIVVPDGDNYNAISSNDITRSLKPFFDILEDAEHNITQCKSLVAGNTLLENYVAREEQKIADARRKVEEYQAATIQKLPELITDYVAALQRVENMMQRAYQDNSTASNLSTNFEAFDELGIDVVISGIPLDNFEVPSVNRATNATGIANNDSAPKDVVFDHISYEDLLAELARVRNDMQLVKQNAGAEASNQINKKLDLIENLELQFQDKASFEIAMQSAARAVLEKREELRKIDNTIEAARNEPDWARLDEALDKLTKRKESVEQFKARLEKAGKLDTDEDYLEIKKFEVMRDAHGHWAGLYAYFDRNHAAGVTNAEIENGYRNTIRAISSPSVKKLLASSHDNQHDLRYDSIVAKLDAAKAVLLDPLQRANYDSESLARKQKMADAYQRMASLDQLASGDTLRVKARQQLLQDENLSPFERRLNKIPWDKVATSKPGQWALLTSRLGAQSLSPSVLVIGGSILFVTGSSLFPIVLTAAAASAFSEYKLGMSPTNFVDRQIEGIYGRAKLYLDMTYTTAIDADMRGYLKLGQRTDRMESMLIQFLNDFKSQFGEDYVQEILFEIVRTKSHLRFDEGFYGDKSQMSEKLDMDIEQTQNRKTFHSLRMQLILGEIFPPSKALTGPDADKLNAMIDEAKGKRISEKEWQHIILQDPKFSQKFSTEKQIKRRISQPTDIFSLGQDASQFPLGIVGTLPYLKDALSDASLESNAPDAHRLKRDVMNLFQVIELGHRLTNAWNYQLGVIAENQANSLIDKNISGSGYKEFAQKVLRKQSAGLSAAVKDKSRGKKSAKGVES